MSILHVKDRIVLGLLDDLGEVEVERRVILAHQHDEANGIASDLFDNLAKRHEIAGSLGHFYRLAIAQKFDQLAEPTSSAPAPPVAAFTAACMRLT